MTSPRGGLREEADPGEEVGVAATGLSVAATARRRPKTPGDDRAEKGLTGKVGLAEKVAPRGRSGSRRGPPASQGGKGTARVPASRGPQRGGGHGPSCGGAGRPNGPATASSGRTGGGVPGPGNRGDRKPGAPRGGFPGGGRKGLRARKDTNLRARSPPLGGHPYPPPPADLQPGFSV